MATWEDGPEYAPMEAPEGFDAGDAPTHATSTLTGSRATRTPTPTALATHPADEPAAYGVERGWPALAQLDPGVRRDARDPHEPYAITQTAVTNGGSAWGSAHRAPHQPIMVSSSRGREPDVATLPPPAGAPIDAVPFSESAPVGAPQRTPSGTPGQTTAWAPAPSGPAILPPQPRADLTLGTLWDSLTPPFIIAVLVGCVAFPVSPLALIAAAYTAGRARRIAIPLRRAAILAVVGSFHLGLFGAVGGGPGFWGGASLGGLLLSWCLLAYALIRTAVAIRRNEPLTPAS